MPLAVVNLQDNVSITSATRVGLLWEDGANDNGRPVIDYLIEYDQSTGDWVELASGVTEREYTTQIGLLAGETYTFRVYARNSVGFSPATEISILVAEVPDQPNVPTSIYSYPNVILSWINPYDGASPITSYQITIRHTDGVTFSPELNYCDGSDSSIVSTNTCTVPVTTLRSTPFDLQWG